MTKEPTPPNPSEDDMARQQLMNAIEQGIQEEDYEFIVQVANHQTSLRPFEIVEYMDVKRRHTEDTIESRRWGDALNQLLDSLKDQQFSEDEQEIINTVIRGLEFEAIAENQDLAEEPVIDGPQETDEQESANDWDNEKFFIQMEEEELNRILKLPVFIAARGFADGSASGAVRIDLAIKILDEAHGETGLKMRQVMDWFVFKHAELYATGSFTGAVRLDLAEKTVNTYASSPEEASRIKAALDKYVFKHAESYVTGSLNGTVRLDLAKKVIENYASLPSRRDAMFRLLGMM